MDPNDSDPFEGPFDFPELDSGSAYEISDSDLGQKSHDKGAHAGVFQGKGKEDKEDISSGGESDSYSTALANPNPDNKYTDEWIAADALQWAATFVPPEVEDIPVPNRGAYSIRSKKRKLERSNGNPARAKRVRAFYSKDYRDLLNIEIHDAGVRSIHEDNILLEDDQIGCSLWSSEEKNLFFAGLSRLGRDNVRGIAAFIGTKSEVEVQEYKQILSQALKGKKRDDARLLDITEIPAAVEFTPECCETMERAADGLASRQEQYEEGVEEAKWGEYWLLTEEVSVSLEKKRSTSKLENDEKVKNLLPAISLLNLKNWLALSHTVFMNHSEPRLEDNWRKIGETGETPAIRATAFDDFYSLTVSITKRLVSTILFCTMSRMRAMDSNKTKVADININDVEAATKILRMDTTSNEFWIKCSRRNHLSISRQDESNDPIMTYEEVETELRKDYNERGRRSRSHSRRHVDHPEDLSEVYTSSSESLLDSDTNCPSDSDLDNNPFTQQPPSQSQAHSQSQREKLSPEAYEEALETYISAVDARTSRNAEQSIWKLLGQDAPPDLKIESNDELPERPASKLEIERETDGEEWRRREFWSEWEIMGVVGEEEFERNRMRVGRRERKERMRESRGRMIAMRSRFGERSAEYVTESGGDEDGGEEADEENIGTGKGHHDEGEEAENATKHRSYAVYNSDDD